MKIAVVDLSGNHIGYYKTLDAVFGAPGFETTFYLSEASRESMEPLDSPVVWMSGRRLPPGLGQCDRILVPTMMGLAKNVALVLFHRRKVLFFIHNLNRYLRAPSKGGVKEWVKYAVYRTIYSMVGGIGFIDSSLMERSPRKDAMIIPFRNSDRDGLSSTEPVPGEFRIVIPGFVSGKRRDYGFVYREAGRIFERIPEATLWILGTPKNEKERKDLRSFSQEHGESVRCFPDRDFIPPAEYSSALEGASVLLSPMRKTFPTCYGHEVYGETKSSGIVHDAVGFGKRLVLPAGINVPREAEPLIYRYADSDDFIDVLADLAARGPDLSAMEREAVEQASSDRIRERFLSWTSDHR